MHRIVIIMLLLLTISKSEALERPDKEFKIFQFPSNMIPRIDGTIDDWDMVPVSYVIGTEELSETELGIGPKHDLNDLDVKVRVGWVKGLNRLYFCYEAYDDYWNMYYSRGDIFEVVVDADLSGGKFIYNDQFSTWEDSHFRFKGVHAQNYHIFTPPGEGRDWAMVWGCQPWIAELPYANHAYNYNFKEGESGNLILECWITPFDYAPYEGPERAVESKLVEDSIIGLSWAIMDYEENNKYDGFWNLSHKTSMDSNASDQVAFRLMPLEDTFRKSIDAQWSFKIIDMDSRLVAFKDLSYGDITSWEWDFGDNTTSTDQHPMHQYQKTGEYVVILNIKGPAGTSRRVKVRQVAVK